MAAIHLFGTIGGVRGTRLWANTDSAADSPRRCTETINGASCRKYTGNTRARCCRGRSSSCGCFWLLAWWFVINLYESKSQFTPKNGISLPLRLNCSVRAPLRAANYLTREQLGLLFFKVHLLSTWAIKAPMTWMTKNRRRENEDFLFFLKAIQKDNSGSLIVTKCVLYYRLELYVLPHQLILIILRPAVGNRSPTEAAPAGATFAAQRWKIILTLRGSGGAGDRLMATCSLCEASADTGASLPWSVS